ncbi:UDP-N-acetylmuramoyl-L-alanine--D-glutamate ligase [Terrihabitans rhizophilus]|uniref:UDP-N-acetylmuramoylalanine--D-glutamate ligase n=1 Tax=Terrihabitans rhizophilus TaxID=3092662 RepID=A0ABU4RL88_9HYPH|nr:UDP-N-acetylmuramoyl-L-alanine--D-glutamate ligase [Terrihabitans sp. PJ23]MDX6805596.1 UDP-N-acetylmuramoyl-L-alanine--D-glutamate ligase [Terrihabitans sp. PJ23]
MTPATSFRGQRVALFGLGGSGLSTAKSLLAGGADLLAWDDAPASVEKARAAGVPVADLRDVDFARCDCLVLAPGVPLTHPVPHWTVEKARAAGVEIIGDIEVFCRERRGIAPDSALVAITGTNGKSTTTALIAHVLRSAGVDVQMGGNIGVPILDLAPPSEACIHVVECSSYQIDLAPTLDPTVGLLLNLSEDHLERHGTMENYAAIKQRLVARSRTAVIGVDDALCAAIADRVEGAGVHVRRISARHHVPKGIYAEGSELFCETEGKTREVADLGGVGSLRGAHNAQNAAAAMAACLALGLSAESVARGLQTFPGLAHRMEQVGQAGRVLFVNDSKATNTDSAEQALASFPSDIYWILGGKAKTGGIASLQPFFDRVAKAYLIGEAAEMFAETLRDVPHEIAGTMEQAVERAHEDAALSRAEEPVVLLSPACASFDQYANFEVRGDHFRRLVQERIKNLP